MAIGYQQGKSPEEIQRNFPALSLEQVYRTIAYYLGHRLEVDEYLRHQRAGAEQPTTNSEPNSNPTLRRMGGSRFGGDSAQQSRDMRNLEDNGYDLNAAGLSNLDTDSQGSQVGQTVVPDASNSDMAFQTTPPPSGFASRTSVPSSQTAMPSQAAIDRPSQFEPSIIAPSTDPTLVQIESAGKLGPYEIVKKLGQGGMGTVYLARQVSLDRKVAVKVLNSQLAGDASFVARFTREAYAAAQLTHHNIVQIHDIGEENDVHYFSMEFVEGKTLNGLLKSGGHIEPKSAVSYILQAAHGLKFAHDHAMIHRDIKPDNLLVNDQGLVKVADLGLVKRKGTQDVSSRMLTDASDASVTGAASAMGTPAYMPPEQARDAASVDGRAPISIRWDAPCMIY